MRQFKRQLRNCGFRNNLRLKNLATGTLKSSPCVVLLNAWRKSRIAATIIRSHGATARQVVGRIAHHAAEPVDVAMAPVQAAHREAVNQRQVVLGLEGELDADPALLAGLRAV